MKAALLIIDMQKGCLEPGSEDSLYGAAETINRTSRFFRELGYPVFVVQDKNVGEGPGSTPFEVLEAVETCPSDISIHKTQLNAFWQTELESLLREKGVEFLVLSGFSAGYCVLATYNGACERGFTPVLLQNGIAASEKAEADNVQLSRPVISHKALTYLLKA